MMPIGLRASSTIDAVGVEARSAKMNTEDGIAQESVLPFSMYRYVALCLPQAPFEITSCHLCILSCRFRYSTCFISPRRSLPHSSISVCLFFRVLANMNKRLPGIRNFNTVFSMLTSRCSSKHIDAIYAYHCS